MMRVEYQAKHSRRVDALLKAARVNGDAFKADCQAILWEGNKRDRLRGVDRAGKPLKKWRWRVGDYEDADGPTMAPFRELSRCVTAFYARIAGEKREGFTLSAGFEGDGVEILVYHAEGKAGRGRLRYDEKGKPYFVGIPRQVTGIVRDVFGVSRETRQELYKALRKHADSTFMGRIRAAGRSVRRTVYVGKRRARKFFGGFFS